MLRFISSASTSRRGPLPLTHITLHPVSVEVNTHSKEILEMLSKPRGAEPEPGERVDPGLSEPGRVKARPPGGGAGPRTGSVAHFLPFGLLLPRRFQ